MKCLLLALALASCVAQAQELTTKNAAITLKVASFAAARDKVLEIVKSSKGKMADGEVQVVPKGRQHGWMRVQIPAGELQGFLSQIRPLGTLYGEDISTVGGASEDEELQSRIEELAKHEQRLMTILQSPKRMRGSDILFIQDRIFRAGMDKRLLGQRRRDLARQAENSSVLITLFEPEPVKPAPRVATGIGDRFTIGLTNAWGALGTFFGRLTTAFALILVYSLIWVPIGIALWFLWRRFGKTLFRLSPEASESVKSS